MIKRIERGWAGHFCCASQCLWRRNTLVLDEENERGIVVSSVGEMDKNARTYKNVEYDEIGVDRYYETMVFIATYTEPYWDADVTRQVFTDLKWRITKKPEKGVDLEAEEMHEAQVQHVMDNFNTLYEEIKDERT